KFRGTDVEELTNTISKTMVWPKEGQMEGEDARDVVFTLHRLVVAIDKELGIADAEVGEFR
ncbi:MAG: hypothetical protein CW742_02070, partial [Methanoregula sp.]